MIEWLVLVLLIPAILVPVVLLFAFAGCDVFFGLKRLPEEVAVFEPAFTAAFDGVDRDRKNRTLVVRIEPNIRLSRSGNLVRLTLARPLEGELLIRKLFVSQAADTGDPYDAAGDLTEVISDALALVADPNGSSVVLDPFSYNLDHTKALLLAFDIGNAGNVRAENVPAEQARSYASAVQDPAIHEASLLDRQAGYDIEARLYIVEQIEVAQVADADA